MNELEKHNRDVEKQSIKLQQEKNKEIEFTFDSSIKPLKGHRLFEINISTLDVKEASYTKQSYITWHQALQEMTSGSIKKEVVIEKGCVYISALNEKSALNRYKLNKSSATLPKGYLDILY
jgi:phage-related tail protein